MKKIRLILTLSAIACIAFAFTLKESSSSAIEIVPLEKAIKDKMISVTFEANGSYSGKSITCTIKNLNGKVFNIQVPAGTYFKAPSDKEQDLIIPQDQMIVMKIGESKKLDLNGYCCNLSNHAPTSGGKFSLVASKAPKEMSQLLTFLKGKKFENHTIQDAIWSITNKSSVSNVSGADEKSVNDLRKLLFNLTGQKETWYQSPQETTIAEDRSINRETVSISGDLEYETKKGATVHTEVFSPEGTVMMKTNPHAAAFAGTLSYKFSVSVKGWEKGTYKVKVFEDSRVIKTYDFIV